MKKALRVNPKAVAIVKRLGYSKDVTATVKKALRVDKTKSGQQVRDRIERADYYVVLQGTEGFTVIARYMVTKQEISKLQRILQADYHECGSLIHDNGLWDEWVEVGTWIHA